MSSPSARSAKSAEVQGESPLKENSSLRAGGASGQTSHPTGSASPSTPLGEWGYPFPLAYCTDVSAIPPESWSSFEGVRTLVLDALRHRKHPTHMTINEAVNAADRIGARDTWFVHMSHDLGHAETDEALPEGMRLAYDGLVLGGGE